MTRLSEKKLKELLGDRYPEPAAKNKYHNRKTTLDGITFDSQKEANYYCQLLLRQRAGEITSFELQPEFVLQDGFTHEGHKIRPITYRADFKIQYPDGREQVVDVKGKKTKEYMLKKKMLLARYPEIWFTEA